MCYHKLIIDLASYKMCSFDFEHYVPFLNKIVNVMRYRWLVYDHQQIVRI